MSNKESLKEVVRSYFLNEVPYDLRAGMRWNPQTHLSEPKPTTTRTKVHAVAARIRQVADYFQANPKMRVKGTLTDGKKVCALGAVQYSRKIGLTWDPIASRNCNSSQTMDVMESMGIVDVNDSAVPNEQFLSYVRFCADVLDAYAASGDWAGSVNKQPLAKRLKINVKSSVSA